MILSGLNTELRLIILSGLFRVKDNIVRSIQERIITLSGLFSIKDNLVQSR